MSNVTFATLCLVLYSGVASGQSLAELAKKEKQRRQETGRQAPTKVLTEDDLKSAKGETLSITGKEVQDQSAIVPTGDEPVPERKLAERNHRDADSEGLWSQMVKAQREQLAREETAGQKADRIAAMMRKAISDHLTAMVACAGTKLGGDVVDSNGNYIGTFTGPVVNQNAAACARADQLRTDYDRMWNELWALDGARMVTRGLPRHVDGSP